MVGFDQPSYATPFSRKQSPPRPHPKAKKRLPILEIKGGYFLFYDSTMRKIYRKGGEDVQLSLSCPIQRYLQIYGSVAYLERHGRSLTIGEKTRIWEIPLSLGLKPIIPICSKMQYYFTIGPRYFFLHQHNNASYVNKTIEKSGFGLFANTGFHILPCSHLLVDVFGEFSYKKMHVHPSSALS